MMNCEFCGSPAHVWFNCPKKPDGWKPERMLVRSGMKFVAEIPEGTKLIVHDDKVIAAGPNLPASYVADGGLVPIKLGRPRIHPDRKAYKAQKERERRARLKADQSKRED